MAPADTLRRIEEAFAPHRFLGLQVGALLNDLVIIEFIHGRGTWSAGDRVKDALRCARAHARLLGAAHRPGVPALSGCVLTTWMGVSRTADVLAPVIEALGADRCVSVNTGKPLAASPAAAQFSAADVPFPRYRAWRGELAGCEAEWRRSIRALCRSERLPPGAGRRMWLAMLDGTQRILGWIELLRHNRPAAILTEYDRNARCACLMQAARHLGIPSFTLTHGIVHDGAVGYAPILADFIYNWGEADRERLIGAGVPPERCVLAGCPRRPLQIKTERSLALSGLRLPVETSSVAMLGLSPWGRPETARMIELFCSALRQVPTARGFIRLHPSLRNGDVLGMIAEGAPVVVAPPSMSLDACLAAADLVVSGGSGLVEDALTAGRPVALLAGARDGQSSWAVQLVSRAGCSRIESVDELVRELRLAAHAGWCQAQVQKAAGYLRWAYVRRGDEAARFIAAHLSDLTLRRA